MSITGLWEQLPNENAIMIIIMNATLTETIHHRIERLEQEAGDLRQTIIKIRETFVEPTQTIAARLVIHGKTYEVTRAEVDAVRKRLAKTPS